MLFENVKMKKRLIYLKDRPIFFSDVNYLLFLNKFKMLWKVLSKALIADAFVGVKTGIFI